tara:strand:- start:1161 stop:2258 length:1098 start_codon:yes stop_codon:yes gene_type:complete
MKIKTLFILLILAVSSITVVVVLFLLSEHEVHRNNAFVRRYPHHPITKKYDLPIKYNSYYVSGFDNDILYLGNNTAPLHLLEVNLKTKDTNHIQIRMKSKDLTFQSLKVKMQPPYFFIMDGSVPCIFRGKIGDWNAHLWMKDKAYFNKAMPVDSNKIYINTISSKTQMTTLGLIERQENENINIVLNTDILEKQIDGVFDVDGIMTISPNTGTLGYVYFYRNQFMVMDSNLKLIERQHTIDTVQRVQIKVANLNDNQISKMKAPPMIVNKMAFMYNDLLLINSDRLGKYEDEDMLKEASIIDVYNWQKESYEFSFYFYHIGKESVKEFAVFNDYLIGLIDDKLSVYEIGKKQFNQVSIKQKTIRL